MSSWFDSLFFILMIAGGLFGVSDYISEKSKKLGSLVNKIVPAQGIIGIILTVIGAIELIASFRYIGDSFLLWLTNLYVIVIALLLGILLSYKLIVKLFLNKNEEIEEKTSKVVDKVQTWQTPLAWICFSNGILMLLFMASIEAILKNNLMDMLPTS